MKTFTADEIRQAARDERLDMRPTTGAEILKAMGFQDVICTMFYETMTDRIKLTWLTNVGLEMSQYFTIEELVNPQTARFTKTLTAADLCEAMELLQKKRDDSLIDMPCPIGTPVYMVSLDYKLSRTYEDGEISTPYWRIDRTQFAFNLLHRIGVDVFLTREEAEEKCEKSELP